MIRLVFVYPSLAEVECFCEPGVSLCEAAQSVGIAMDAAILPTCQVSVQCVNELVAPTAKEISDFGEKNVFSNHVRYAHTYIVSPDLDEAKVLLNIIRIEYVDRNKISHPLTAILNENLMAVRDRNSATFDRAFACRGSLACASCHVLDYSGEGASDDEIELLYTAPGFCDQSRLGCQIRMTKNRDKSILKNPRGVSA